MFRLQAQAAQHRSALKKAQTGNGRKGQNKFHISDLDAKKLERKHTKEQVESNRGEELLLVPSDSPPGLTQTMESMKEEPVLVVGRVPNPAFLMLHQSPHWLRRFCWPERP